MKVVIAHNRYASGQPSGENTIVDTELTQLAASGVDVVPFMRDSDEIAGMSLFGRATLPISPIYNAASQRALGALLRSERPDVLHLHNPYPLLSPWVIRTAHRNGVPVIQTVHNYRQVCSSGLYFRDGRVCQDCAGLRFGFPAVRHACYRGSRAQSVVMASTLAAHRATWRSVDRYIALTSAIADHLREFGIQADRITVKPNAVADPGAPSGDPGRGFLFAARLTGEKGLGLLLDAWRRHPVGSLGTLRIAGDGPERDRAEAAATERDDVEYLGQRDQAGIRAAMREAACVVATPTWHDVLPTVAIEAFASGRPVLATRMGGLPYLVGETGSADAGGPATGPDEPAAGWVVDPTPEAVAAGLATARAAVAVGTEACGGTTGGGGTDRTARPDWGRAARNRYERNFSPDVITKRLIEIYTEVASA